MKSGRAPSRWCEGPDGTPHVTPIGSVLLNQNGSGMYFDILNKQLATNVAQNPQVTILAVNSGCGRWLRALLRGHFNTPPGVRLTATVGPPRASTRVEVARFHRVLGPLLRTRGGWMLWGSLPRVRDLEISEVTRLELGAM